MKIIEIWFRQILKQLLSHANQFFATRSERDYLNDAVGNLGVSPAMPPSETHNY